MCKGRSPGISKIKFCLEKIEQKRFILNWWIVTVNEREISFLSPFIGSYLVKKWWKPKEIHTGHQRPQVPTCRDSWLYCLVSKDAHQIIFLKCPSIISSYFLWVSKVGKTDVIYSRLARDWAKLRELNWSSLGHMDTPDFQLPVFSIRCSCHGMKTTMRSAR